MESASASSSSSSSATVPGNSSMGVDDVLGGVNGHQGAFAFVCSKEDWKKFDQRTAERVFERSRADAAKNGRNPNGTYVSSSGRCSGQPKLYSTETFVPGNIDRCDQNFNGRK